MKRVQLVSKLVMIAIISMMFVWQSCEKDDEIIVKKVTVKLSYEDGTKTKEGISVSAKSAETGTVFKQKTDKDGSVTFQLVTGTYDFSSSEVRLEGGKKGIYNGSVNIMISNDYIEGKAIELNMLGSKTSQLIIKEIYFGGCPADNKYGYYSYGQYIVLYNNSTSDVDLKNLCIGSMGNNSYFMKFDINDGDTEPYWFEENWTPINIGYFYFPNEVILKPGKQILVAVSGAIDHTQTYPNSVDLSNPDNYVMYDIDVFDHALTYPAPATGIEPSHYLSAVKYGLGTAWSVAISSPAIFLFYPQGQDPKTYGDDRTDDDYWHNNEKFPRKKVPTEWVTDAIDVFAAGKEDKNMKRLNPKIDAGYIYMVSKLGYSMYRNVDKELTESIKENEGKLVYNYAGGTKDVEAKHGSTDPSGIDAEASMAKGAIIIFKDTNNSGNDFHMRKKASVKK